MMFKFDAHFILNVIQLKLGLGSSSDLKGGLKLGLDISGLDPSRIQMPI